VLSGKFVPFRSELTAYRLPFSTSKGFALFPEKHDNADLLL